MANYNIPSLEEDKLDPNKVPNDGEPVDDEGTAPPVKSGYRPKPVKSKVTRLPTKTFT